MSSTDENSPNHEELLSLYSRPPKVTKTELRGTVEEIATHLLNDIGVGKGGEGIVAVRCRELGACVGTRSGGLKWFPPYYQAKDKRRIKDVTGGQSSPTHRYELIVVSRECLPGRVRRWTHSVRR